jgi:hypothetical protein
VSIEDTKDRNVGWWLRHHALTVNIVTVNGHVITTTGEGLMASIDAHNERMARESAWRAA